MKIIGAASDGGAIVELSSRELTYLLAHTSFRYAKADSIIGQTIDLNDCILQIERINGLSGNQEELSTIITGLSILLKNLTLWSGNDEPSTQSETRRIDP